MSFFCVACGECCRHITEVPLAKDLDRGDGTCIYLKDNMCQIYQKRPNICNSDFVYNNYYSWDYTEKEYYDMNHAICRTLIKNSKVLTPKEKESFLKKLS